MFIGQTVTVKGTEKHGLVTDVWTYKGVTRVAIQSSFKSDPIVYNASELTPYIVQSPDTIIVRDGSTQWMFEVLDVKADMSAVYVILNGEIVTCDMRYVVRVIPASIGRMAGQS